MFDKLWDFYEHIFKHGLNDVFPKLLQNNLLIPNYFQAGKQFNFILFPGIS